MSQPIIGGSFPRELLESPVEARIKYFEDYHVAHPNIVGVYNRLCAVLRQPAGIKIVMVVGLTGTGKTTVRSKIEKTLVEQTLPSMEHDLGRLPFVSVQVPGYERGFDWADLYRRGLRRMEAPLIDEKVPVPPRSHRSFPIAETKRMAGLRQAFEGEIRSRRPPAVMFDDAHRFARVTGAHKLSEQQEVIQSLAQESESLFILFGTYKLNSFMGLSGELARRSKKLHLPRYDINRPGEADIFLSVLTNFRDHLPLAQTPDLLAHRDFLYQRSVGCVGILKDWLSAALALACDSKRGELTLAHLKETAKDVSDCLTILDKAREGEADMESNSNESLLIQALNTKPSKAKAAPNGSTSEAKGDAKKPRPFERLPERDPVGIPQLSAPVEP